MNYAAMPGKLHRSNDDQKKKKKKMKKKKKEKIYIAVCVYRVSQSFASAKT